MIGYQVVDEIRAHRAGIAEIMNLYRRRLQREDFTAGVTRIPLQVDQDVDAVGMDGRGTVDQRLLSQIDEAIASGYQSRAHRPVVVAAIRVRDNLELLAVVQFE